MRIFTFIYLLHFSFIGFSQEESPYNMPPIFTIEDTLMTYSDQYDKVYYIHTLRPRQTLYSIADYFGLDLFTLYDDNPKYRISVAKVGDTIRIPIPTYAVHTDADRPTNAIPVYYKVKPKDNIFRISRIMYDLNIHEVKRINNLSQQELSIGEVLFIGWWNISGVRYDTTNRMGDFNLASIFEGLQEEFILKSQEQDIITQKGMAQWNRSVNQKSGFYIIHRNAKPGSVIEIENPFYKRVAYAKVIANLPPNTYSSEVIAVVSPALANYLGVMDTRFFVKMRYLQ